MGFDKDYVLKIVNSARYERMHGSLSLLHHPKNAPCPGECLMVQSQIPVPMGGTCSDAEIEKATEKPWRVWRVEPDHWKSCPECSKSEKHPGGFVYMLPIKWQDPDIDMSWAEEIDESHPFFPYYYKKDFPDKFRKGLHVH
jgi:hypothetical protein